VVVLIIPIRIVVIPIIVVADLGVSVLPSGSRDALALLNLLVLIQALSREALFVRDRTIHWIGVCGIRTIVAHDLLTRLLVHVADVARELVRAVVNSQVTGNKSHFVSPVSQKNPRPR